MGLLLGPRLRSSAPPVGVGLNTGHPLAENLKHCIMLLEGLGLIAVDSAQLLAAISPGSAPPTWIPGGLHFGQTVSGSAVERIQAPGRMGTSIGRVQSFEAWVRIAGSTRGLICGLTSSDTATNGANATGVSLGVGNTTMDNSGTNLLGLNENVAWVTPGIALPNGGPQFVQVGVVYYPTGTNSRFYVNGRQVAAVDWGALHAPTAANLDFFVGGYFTSAGAANRSLLGDIKLARHWEGRALTDADFRALYLDPWGMMVPSQPLMQKSIPLVAALSWHTSVVKVWK